MSNTKSLKIPDECSLPNLSIYVFLQQSSMCLRREFRVCIEHLAITISISNNLATGQT